MFVVMFGPCVEISFSDCITLRYSHTRCNTTLVFDSCFFIRQPGYGYKNPLLQ
jgi:hypothetical protein